jgi:hypothetical protein
MTAKAIDIPRFVGHQTAQQAADLELMRKVAERFVQAVEYGQDDRLQFFLKSWQNIMRVALEYEPDELDEVDRQLDELKKFFK